MWRRSAIGVLHERIAATPFSAHGKTLAAMAPLTCATRAPRWPKPKITYQNAHVRRTCATLAPGWPNPRNP